MMNNKNKTVREIVKENEGKEIHLYSFDGWGIWRELLLSEINMRYIPNLVKVVKVNGNIVNICID